MKRFTIVTFCMFFLVCLTTTTVWAQNPHFVGKPTATLSGNNVNVCWKEAGLGSNENET